MSYFKHSHALVETENIGDGTRVWAFAHILLGARIGSGCNICDGVFIENDVVIGDNVTIKCGVQLWDGITVEDGVFIGPNATFTNDNFPRSKQYPQAPGHTLLQTGCSIGANATILPGVTVAAGAMVGAGSVVTRSVPPNAIVQGNPARIVGYTNTKAEGTIKPQLFKDDRKPPYSDKTAVRGVTVHKFPLIPDIRGSLTVGEFDQQIPFVPKRYFMVFDVPSKETRGEHAHHTCHQFLICIRGSCSVLADDGTNRTEVLLDAPDKGIYLPPMIWGVQYKYSADATLLVFASHNYEAADYIRSYSEFLEAVNR
jgi:acetyltransferase-like isoleucine patch superfamily enzyme/dTDP-4-dehydrorhamnose 3,5-epimerase-like enzyme